jgi:hypothetical protein
MQQKVACGGGGSSSSSGGGGGGGGDRSLTTADRPLRCRCACDTLQETGSNKRHVGPTGNGTEKWEEEMEILIKLFVIF